MFIERLVGKLIRRIVREDIPTPVQTDQIGENTNNSEWIKYISKPPYKSGVRQVKIIDIPRELWERLGLAVDNSLTATRQYESANDHRIEHGLIIFSNGTFAVQFSEIDNRYRRIIDTELRYVALDEFERINSILEKKSK